MSIELACAPTGYLTRGFRLPSMSCRNTCTMKSLAASGRIDVSTATSLRPSPSRSPIATASGYEPVAYATYGWNSDVVSAPLRVSVVCSARSFTPCGSSLPQPAIAQPKNRATPGADLQRFAIATPPERGPPYSTPRQATWASNLVAARRHCRNYDCGAL